MKKSRLFRLFLCIVIFLSISACVDEEEDPSEQDEDRAKVILVEDLDEIDTGSAYKIHSAAMNGDNLELCLEYGGGCAPHILDLFILKLFAESYPVQTWAKISHDDSGDNCEALIYECINYDMTPLKSVYTDFYQSSEGTIIIHLEGFEDYIEYTF